MTRTFTKSTIAALLLVAAIVAPSTAAAESPTYGLFELKLGGYYPAVDDEFGGNGPFETYFGTDNLLIFETEIDAYFWDGFGKLGGALHIGFSSVEGNAQTTTETEDEVGDTTTFRTIPLRASVVYRFDYLATDMGIPLVPKLLAGLSYVPWSIDGTDGNTAEADGTRGRGATFGWHASLGLNLLLDIIDPSTAAVFDLNWGINNSYIFAEYMITQIDDFGSSTSFDLSDNYFNFGLAFEF
jgi:hypothetical protein